MLRGYRFRLYPTAEQEVSLRQTVGVVRLIYNLCLEQRRLFHRQYRRQTGKPLNYISQGRELTELRAAVSWIGDAPRTPQEQALRDLDAAYNAFFAGRSGYPTPRKRGVHDRFRVKGVEARTVALNGKWSSVHIPKAGLVKMRQTRKLPAAPLSVTVSLEAGAWYGSFSCETEGEAVAGLPSVGIDRGVVNTLALSTGEVFHIPAKLDAVDKRRRRAQRVIARQTKDSNRQRRQKARVAALYAQAKRIRMDWAHRTTTSIARRFGCVTLEALKIGAMTARGRRSGVRQKAGLNRTILSRGWGDLERMLAYKLALRGGTLLKVDPAYTSQTCAECGVIDRRSRESQARFHCTACGHIDNADTNAARNIRRASSSLLGAEAGRLGPAVEPPTRIAA